MNRWKMFQSDKKELWEQSQNVSISGSRIRRDYIEKAALLRTARILLSLTKSYRWQNISCVKQVMEYKWWKINSSISKLFSFSMQFFIDNSLSPVCEKFIDYLSLFCSDVGRGRHFLHDVHMRITSQISRLPQDIQANYRQLNSLCVETHFRTLILVDWIKSCRLKIAVNDNCPRLCRPLEQSSRHEENWPDLCDHWLCCNYPSREVSSWPSKVSFYAFVCMYIHTSLIESPQ